MTQAQHTPGPWAICTLPGAVPEYGVYSEVSASGCDLALVRFRGDGETEANAALIAAAPAMLEALGDLLVVFESLVPVAGNHACYRAACAAIAQAEGRV